MALVSWYHYITLHYDSPRAMSVLYGVSDELLQKLQVIQNAAARVATGARKFDHITPVLHELHWLPVRQRIRFKLAMTVYKNA